MGKIQRKPCLPIVTSGRPLCVPTPRRCTVKRGYLSPSPVPLSPDQAGSVVLPTPVAMISESLLGGGPNGFTGRALLLLFRRMLESTWSYVRYSVCGYACLKLSQSSMLLSPAFDQVAGVSSGSEL